MSLWPAPLGDEPRAGSGLPALGETPSRRRLGLREARPSGELLRAFADRDPRAAEALYDRFAPRVFGLGMTMLGDAAQAEELVRDTFVKMWRNSSKFDPSKGSLDTWVLLSLREAVREWPPANRPPTMTFPQSGFVEFYGMFHASPEKAGELNTS
jgi:hypothetical protein